VLGTTLRFFLQKLGLARFRIFNEKGRRLETKELTYYASQAAGVPGA